MGVYEIIERARSRTTVKTGLSMRTRTNMDGFCSGGHLALLRICIDIPGSRLFLVPFLLLFALFRLLSSSSIGCFNFRVYCGLVLH